MVRVDGREFFWREGMTVADLLKELGDPYPYAVVRSATGLSQDPTLTRPQCQND